MADETGGKGRGRRPRPTTIDVKPEASATVAESRPPEEAGPAQPAAAPPSGESVAAETRPAESISEPAAPVSETPGAETTSTTPAPAPEASEVRSAETSTAATAPEAAPPAEARPSAMEEPTPAAAPRPQAEIEPAPPPRAPEPFVAAARRREEERREPPPRRSLVPALVGGLVAAGLVAVIGFGGMALGLFGPGVDREAEFKALNERIQSLEGERRRLIGAQQNLAAIEPRLATVERMATELQRQAAQSAEARPADTGLRSEVTSLREQLTALEGRIAAQPAGGDGRADSERLAADVARLGSALAALDRRIAALDAAPLRGEVTRLGEEVRRLQNAPPSALERNAALVIAAEALERAVARGDAFAAELAAVKSLGIEGFDFAALEARAATGVPSRAALSERFRPLARGIIAAAQPAPEGTVGRLLQSAGGLVSVRPTGEPAGEGAAATVARVETKLSRGDLAGALAEFRSLPAPAQAAAGTFGADLAARVAAESLVDRIKSDILRGAARRQG